MATEIETKVFTLAKEMLNVQNPTRATTWEELGVDSLDVTEFFMKAEEELGVQVPDQEATSMKSLGDLISYAEKHKGGA
jgi:acyl carrier protein